VAEPYSEIHVYADVADIRRKFEGKPGATNAIIVLKPDSHLSNLSKGGIVPIGQMYVDLWQLGTPAKTLIDYLNTKMKLIEMGTLREVIRRAKERI
jgi:hypothetical protein